MNHKSQLIEYLELRRKQFQTIKPILALYGVDHIVNAQIQGIDVCLQSISNSGPDERKIENIRFTLKTTPGFRIIQQDVESILETGKPVLPEDLSLMKAFLDEQARKRREEEQAQEKELRRRSREEKERTNAAKKRKEQEETIERLGLRDVIAGLRAK